MEGHVSAVAAHAEGHGVQFGLTNKEFIVFACIVTGIILLLTYLFTKKKSSGVPAKLQNTGEMIVEAVINILEPILGHDLARKYLPFFGTLLIFIMVSNVFLLIPGTLPLTSDLSTTAALAFLTLVCVHFFNLRLNGIVKVVKRWLNPYPEMTKQEELPENAGIGQKFGKLFNFGIAWIIVFVLIILHVIDNGARFMSLSLRLFGNIFGEHLIFHKVAEVAVSKPILVIPLIIPLLILALDTMIFMIQAFIFTYLSIFYLVEEAHVEH